MFAKTGAKHSNFRIKKVPVVSSQKLAALYFQAAYKQRALTCLLNDHLCRQLLDRRGVLMDIPKARPANIFNNYAGLINCAINLNKSPHAHTSTGHTCRKIYWVRRFNRVKLQFLNHLYKYCMFNIIWYIPAFFALCVAS